MCYGQAKARWEDAIAAKAKAVKEAKTKEAKERVRKEETKRVIAKSSEVKDACQKLTLSFAPRGTGSSDTDLLWSKKGKRTAHTCGRPSHLIMAPRALNKHTEGLNILAAYLLNESSPRVGMTASVGERLDALKELGAAKVDDPVHPGNPSAVLDWRDLKK